MTHKDPNRNVDHRFAEMSQGLLDKVLAAVESSVTDKAQVKIAQDLIRVEFEACGEEYKS